MIQGPGQFGNEPPTLEFQQPTDNLAVGQGAPFLIGWQDDDRDDNASISFLLVNTATNVVVHLVSGLEENDATWRLARHGPNRLREKPPRPLLATFVDQFKSLLILILFGAAVIAWTIGAWRDAIVIMIVTLLNALLGFSQEYRAERSLGALKQLLAVHARVRRQGETQEIPANELVPGDIVLLEAGDRVPADGRLLTAESMEIDESSLTGESQPVSKRAGEVLNGDTPVSERSNMAFMNTMVNRGRGELAVTGTGMRTEIGRVAEALSASEEPPTPLQIQLDRLGKRLSIVAGGFVAAILGLSLLSGRHWGEALMEAIALAVATVPEGLPAVATVTLAIGMQRMARNRAIVKRLAAVEALGCTTVIGADKTGTLTLNQMTARAFTFGGRRYTVTGEGYRVNGAIRIDRGGAPAEGAEPDAEPGELSALLLPLALCNDSALHDGRVLGDPMEGALLVLAEKGGVDRERAAEATPRIAQVPFDAGHKFMATFHRDGDAVRLYVKGAPEAIMARSAHVLNADGERPLDDTGRGRLDEENAHLAERQMRVLAVASREIPSEGFVPEGDLWRYLEGLTLLGLVGLLDPPRPEVKAAIERCQQAGIEVKMITGDQGATAVAIARELGLGERVMTGAELDGLDPARAADEIARTGVFARVTPVHKLTIVEALQSRGEIVAMTGDGVNDAPALKKAHIGVAMGRSGTEVA
ncbi:MAG: HAD-IC family P-type ATPase, partial [SAR324 cluster bacterium]|nr:HAD-IC family P-type ATPase [SAR324 cluster bacterium]